MAEPSSSSDLLQGVLAALAALGTALGGWATVVQRRLKRHDFIPRREYQEAISDIRQEIRETRTELGERIDNGTRSTHERLDQVMLALTKDR